MATPVDADEQRALFKKLFICPDFYGKAKNRGLKSQVKVLLRSIHWKLYLQYLNPTERASWARDAASHRQAYTALLDKHILAPTVDDGDVQVNNPLSLHTDSKWAAYFKDNELSAQIKLDIDRTHNEKDFFRDEKVQAHLSNILFVWAKENPDPSYRQGMNELLAPIYQTVSRDARPLNSSEDLLDILVDDAYIEHDTYFLFNQVMVVMRQYFEYKKPDKNKKNAVVGGGRDAMISKDESSIAKKADTIFAQLGQVDKPLHAHLSMLEIPYNIFLLRWIRLLFAREFHLEDVMIIWDAIFSAAKFPLDPRKGFGLVDYISQAMLFYVRSTLLEYDDSSFCLRRLIRFPPVEDIRVIVMKALFLFNPEKGTFGVNATEIDAIALKAHIRTVPVEKPVPVEESKAPKRASLMSSTKNLVKSSGKAIANLMSGSSGQTTVREESNDSAQGVGQRIRTLSDSIENPFTASLRKDLLDAREKNENLTSAMTEMSSKLDSVVEDLHMSLVKSKDSGEPYKHETVLAAIAEMKYVADILCGRLAFFPSETTSIAQAVPDMSKLTTHDEEDENGGIVVVESGNSSAPVEEKHAETTPVNEEETETVAEPTEEVPLTTEDSPVKKDVEVKETLVDPADKNVLFGDGDADDGLFNNKVNTSSATRTSRTQSDVRMNGMELPDFLLAGDDEVDGLF